MPDGTSHSLVGVQGEQLAEAAFAAVKSTWDKIKDGSGRIKITETDRAGRAHAGFKASITTRIGQLMARPSGRQLVTSLLAGGFADTDIKVYDASGVERSDPVFIFLGHEMIHARHNQLGRNRTRLNAVDPTRYNNREEEETVATGTLGITENQLRVEHGLAARAGSRGVDKRPP